ncbi:Hypothetical protein A7982_09980 [Minicystis rosea]|nr:Hypothetical protein A7982_09980 [Minicystis rosea]
MIERIEILFLASNPLRDTPVAVDVEARSVQEQIALAQARDRFDLVYVPAPRLDDPLRENARCRPQIVHVTGHGSARALLFLDHEDRPTSIDVPSLVRLMNQLGQDEARLVVLNYCESAPAAQAIVDDATGRIACVVGTRVVVPDRQAIPFAAAFYGALAARRSVARAFAEGQTQVALEGGKADVFSLHVRAGIDAASLSFGAAPDAVSSSSIAATRRQLRAPPPDFTGRIKEMADVRALFGQSGVLVSGQGGVGKTALALMLADALVESYPDAQIDLDLRGSSPTPLTPEAAMAEVIHAFDPALDLPASVDALAKIYRATLRGRRALLFFDDAASADQIASLLPPSGSFAIITAWSWFVAPGVAPYDLAEMTPPDAVALVRRIATRLHEDDAAELASRCGYLPLSLRAAAGALAQRRDLKPAQYLAKLQAAEERVKLVEQVLAEGIDLLVPPERVAWLSLGVFPADFEASAAAAVIAVGSDRAAEIMSSLLQRNLIEWDEATDRYRLHDLARDYARLHLDAAQLVAVGLRFTQYFASILRHAEERYAAGGAAMIEGLALFDREHRNIEAALSWSMANVDADERVPSLLRRLATDGASTLALRTHALDRASWFSAALAAAKRAGDREATLLILAASAPRSSSSPTCSTPSSYSKSSAPSQCSSRTAASKPSLSATSVSRTG